MFLTNKNDAYSLIENRPYIESGGSIVNDSILFMHPPRSDCYKILEFCPMPYFYNNKKESTWDWNLVIGSNFAIDGVYSIQYEDTFKIRYVIEDTELVYWEHDNLLCYRIAATSISRFGVSKATYYLNNRFGVIKCALEPVNKSKFSFELIKKTNDPTMLNMNIDFMRNYNYFKKVRNPFYTGGSYVN